MHMYIYIYICSPPRCGSFARADLLALPAIPVNSIEGSTPLYTVIYCTILCCTRLCYRILDCTVLCYAILYYWSADL